MCGICGCSEQETHAEHHHSHTHDDPAAHHHHGDEGLVHIEQDILAKNNQFARQNQGYFLKNKILALNIMSSPGSGKTTLLAKTIADLKNKINMAVVVGDQQTDYDAKRLEESGAPAVQVNTGKVCHLDAHMVGHAIDKLPVKEKITLFIENVGNLVCPAMFNLGEKYKIVILSVTEGDNKPLKYPDMFRSADLMVLTKVDLLPYVTFDVAKCMEYARRIKPDLKVVQLSATQGRGMDDWYGWLLQQQ